MPLIDYHDETPPEDEYCTCGAPLNACHQCMNPGNHWSD